jgi:hypothetical protein
MSINLETEEVKLELSCEQGVKEPEKFPDDLTNFKDLLERTDDNGKLQIYSYKYCDNESSDNIKRLRGLVYCGEKLLFKSFGYTQEFIDTDSFITPPLKTTLFFPSEEGTLLRVFFFEDKWYISTNRKLDATKSRWGGGKSFGEIFMDALFNLYLDTSTTIDTFTKELNKEYVYLFLVRNTEENRIVSKGPVDSTVYHVGTILQDGKVSFDVRVPLIPCQTQLNFQSMEEVLEYVKNTDPFVRQGVIGFLEDGTQIKIVNSKYKLYSQVRGNEPSVKFRYLNVRTNPTYVRLLHELYPEYVQQFTMYEGTIFKVAKKIHASYIKRFVNKEHVVTDKISYRIIREAHGRHVANRQVKVTLEMIVSILSEMRFVSTLNALIKQELYFPRSTAQVVV